LNNNASHQIQHAILFHPFNTPTLVHVTHLLGSLGILSNVILIVHLACVMLFKNKSFDFRQFVWSVATVCKSEEMHLRLLGIFSH